MSLAIDASVSNAVSLSLGFDSYRLAKLAHAPLPQALPQAGDDGLGDAGTFIDHAGVNLRQRGAGCNLLPCVGGVKNSSDANNG